MEDGGWMTKPMQDITDYDMSDEMRGILRQKKQIIGSGRC